MDHAPPGDASTPATPATEPTPGGSAAAQDAELTTAPDAVEAVEASPVVPDHAHVVLVPLANPETSSDLLRIARAIVRADGGKVVALSIAMGDADAEQAVTRMEQLEEVVAGVDDQVEVLRRTASTVARGILDAVREVGADMMVLGLTHVEDGRFELGRIVQSVVAAASCDVLLYRPGRAVTDLDELNRVVVGVDDSPISRAAARVGILLAEGFDRPAEALTVIAGGRHRAEGWDVLDRALTGVTDQHLYRRRLVVAASAAAGITSSTKREDLVVVGFDERSAMQEWVDGDVVRDILEQAAGPTIAVSRLAVPTGSAGHARRVVDWLRPQLTDVERETIDWRSQSLAKASLDYMTLIVVAAVLASLGLLLNSPAVVIGAMLVAPLMGPLVAFAIALRVARMDVVRQALQTILIGAASAFGVSVLIGLLAPLDAPTSEMLARGSPTLLDAGVAFASGLVGAYATARKDIPAALAGVAIAAALVPPLCASGLALGLAEQDLAIGAALLFTVNVVCIAAVATGVFAWLGMQPKDEASPMQQHVTMLGALLVPLVIGAVLIGGAGRFQPSDTSIRLALEDTIPLVEHVESEALGTQPRKLIVTVRGTTAPTSDELADLRARLRTELDVPDLQVEVAFVQLLRAG